MQVNGYRRYHFHGTAFLLLKQILKSPVIDFIAAAIKLLLNYGFLVRISKNKESTPNLQTIPKKLNP